MYLVAGQAYRVVLSWSGSADLDVYVYMPDVSPAYDGTGEDYYARAYSTAKPEILVFTPNITGTWVIAVDFYSRSGSASYELRVEPISASTRALGESTTSIPKINYEETVDSDLDGLPDSIESTLPFADKNNPLFPAIYPPLFAILYILDD